MFEFKDFDFLTDGEIDLKIGDNLVIIKDNCYEFNFMLTRR